MKQLSMICQSDNKSSDSNKVALPTPGARKDWEYFWFEINLLQGKTSWVAFSYFAILAPLPSVVEENVQFIKMMAGLFGYYQYRVVQIGICIMEHLEQGGEPIYYHGPHELCIIAGRPQNQLILS